MTTYKERALVLIDKLHDEHVITTRQKGLLRRAILEFVYFSNEPKKGEWIKVNPEIRGYTDYFRCSACLAIIQLGCLTKECDYIFCPYCKADMRGEKK